jgi:hypothetical protein
MSLCNRNYSSSAKNLIYQINKGKFESTKAFKEILSIHRRTDATTPILKIVFKTYIKLIFKKSKNSMLFDQIE